MNRDVHTGSRPRAGFLLSRSPKAAARGRQHGVESRPSPDLRRNGQQPVNCGL
jgi:hypothetical protein